jgi:hypothetical protein
MEPGAQCVGRPGSRLAHRGTALDVDVAFPVPDYSRPTS